MAPPDPRPRQPPAPTLTLHSPLAAGAPQIPLSSASGRSHLRRPSRARPTHLRVGVRAAVGVRGPPSLPGVQRLEQWGRSPRRGVRVEAGSGAAARRHRSGPGSADPAATRKPNRNCFGRRGPPGGRRSPADGGGATTGRDAGLKMGAGETQQENPRVRASGPKQTDNGRGLCD